LLFENRSAIRRPGTAAYCLAVSLAFTPLRLVEDALTRQQLARTKISAPPIFILGHWRTGTTFLHNLFAADPTLGYVTTAQSTFPRMSVVWGGLARSLLSHFGPATRPMDDMPFGPDLPQEEEIGIANLTRHSWFHAIYFPHRTLELFDRYVTFETATDGEVEGWRRAFTLMVEKATLLAGGRRLVLKSPPNTARIPLLLDVFPNAKFVHIDRDPYAVFASSVDLHRRVGAHLSLEGVDDRQIRQHVGELYRRMTRRYRETRGLIPPGNLVELRYEDLVDDPLRTMEQVYAALGLDGFAAARPSIGRHIDDQRDYRPNNHVLTPGAREEISRVLEWASAPPRHVPKVVTIDDRAEG
jgi:hypothetical protein